MSQAIVTGVPGWLGTAFLSAMVAGLPDSPDLKIPKYSSIRALSHPDGGILSEEMAKNVQIVKADIQDREKVKSLFAGALGATVFHIAGVIHPQRSIKEFYSVNVEGTRNLLELAIEAGVKRFIYVSSNSPCGSNTSPTQRFDEKSPYHPYMNYGKSKMLAEELVNQAHKQGKIETAIIRPPWFYGPFQPPRQTLFFKMIKEGKVPLVGDGNNRRSMAYVDNICQALFLCDIVQLANGQTYWIADKDPYTMNEIIAAVEDVLSSDFNIPVKHKRMHLPSFASEVAYCLDWTLQSAGLYHQKIHVLSEMDKTIACDVTLASSELQYQPKVAVREGMRRSIEWLLANGTVI